jgi:hypothetical protein
LGTCRFILLENASMKILAAVALLLTLGVAASADTLVDVSLAGTLSPLQ